MNNNCFHTADGVHFLIATGITEVEGANYLVNRDGKIVAVVNGEETDVPEVVYNEVGVPYLIVQDLYALAKEKAKKNGVYIAVKQEPIRIWKDVKPGGVIRSVIDGFQEHAVELGDRQLAAQNVIKGEFYGIGKDVLAERYRFVRSEADYDLYEPRADKPTEWVYCDINICCPLWGGIECITTPMINISNPKDCYACNFIVWWGNDGRLNSYRVLRYIRGCGSVYFELHADVPQPMSQARFNPPQVLKVG